MTASVLNGNLGYNAVGSLGPTKISRYLVSGVAADAQTTTVPWSPKSWFQDPIKMLSHPFFNPWAPFPLPPPKQPSPA